MVCLGLDPGAAECKVQTMPLSYGDTPELFTFYYVTFHLENLDKIKIANYTPR